jgi:hypothetical protein
MTRPKLPRGVAIPAARASSAPALRRWKYRTTLDAHTVHVSQPMSEERARKAYGPLLLGPAE